MQSGERLSERNEVDEKMIRKGLGKGLGMGYKNIAPMDSHIHSLSAKGQKTSAYGHELGHLQMKRLARKLGLRATGKKMMSVADIDEKKPQLKLVDADYEVESIKENLGKKAEGYDTFFVEVKDGEYGEVWGVEGVPYNWKTAYRINAKGEKDRDYMRAVIKFEQLNPDYPSSQMEGIKIEVLEREFQDPAYIKEKIENTKRFYDSALDNFGKRIMHPEIKEEFRKRLESGKLDAKSTTATALQSAITEFDNKIDRVRNDVWPKQKNVEKTPEFKALNKEDDVVRKQINALETKKDKIERVYTSKFTKDGHYPTYRRQGGTNIKQDVLDKLKKEVDFRFIDDYKIQSLVMDMIRHKRDGDKRVKALNKKITLLEKKSSAIFRKQTVLKDTATKNIEKQIESLKEDKQKLKNVLMSLPEQNIAPSQMVAPDVYKKRMQRRAEQKARMVKARDSTLKKVNSDAFTKKMASKFNAKGRNWGKQIAEVKTKDQARQLAIEYQGWQSNKSMTWGEVADYSHKFESLGKKFGLVKEFKENGVI